MTETMKAQPHHGKASASGFDASPQVGVGVLRRHTQVECHALRGKEPLC
jgi:hypothetical protein